MRAAALFSPRAGARARGGARGHAPERPPSWGSRHGLYEVVRSELGREDGGEHQPAPTAVRLPCDIPYSITALYCLLNHTRTILLRTSTGLCGSQYAATGAWLWTPCGLPLQEQVNQPLELNLKSPPDLKLARVQTCA